MRPATTLTFTAITVAIAALLLFTSFAASKGFVQIGFCDFYCNCTGPISVPAETCIDVPVPYGFFCQDPKNVGMVFAGNPPTCITGGINFTLPVGVCSDFKFFFLTAFPCRTNSNSSDSNSHLLGAVHAPPATREQMEQLAVGLKWAAENKAEFMDRNKNRMEKLF